MKERAYLVRRSITGHPVRSIAMVLLCAVMSGSLLAGMILVSCVQDGLSVMRRRLGADVMVVPYAALSKKNFDNEFLLGNTGAFYMPGENAGKISEIEGVGSVSAQFFLADIDSELSGSAVHLMGYDPESDFCVAPWITEGTSGTDSAGADDGASDTDIGGAGSAASGSVVAGSEIKARPGDTVTLCGVPVIVTGKMAETGTDYDTSIYVDMATAGRIVSQSDDDSLSACAQMLEDGAVSAILIAVVDGYDPEPVLNSINIHIKKVRAVSSKEMVTGEVSSMRGASLIITVITAVIWCAAMASVFVISQLAVSQRRKEFALMRVMGASRRRLFSIVLSEGAILSAAGSAAGTAVMGAALPLVCHMTGAALDIPVSLPGTGAAVPGFFLALAVSVAGGLAGSLAAASRISHMDPAPALREI